MGSGAFASAPHCFAVCTHSSSLQLPDIPRIFGEKVGNEMGTAGRAFLYSSLADESGERVSGIMSEVVCYATIGVEDGVVSLRVPVTSICGE